MTRPPEAGDRYFETGDKLLLVGFGGTGPESKMRCILLHMNRPREAAYMGSFRLLWRYCFFVGHKWNNLANRRKYVL